MGVPGLFSYFNKKYGQVTFLKTKIKSKLPTILYFDFNCLIHPIVNQVIDEMLLCDVSEHRSLQGISFMKIKSYTDEIINLFENLYEIYIVFDGVAPRAKMNQQRSRRFLSVKNNDDKRRMLFDTNSISPGTEFMDELSNYLKTSYKHHTNVIISDTRDPGEAEHKIMNMIRHCEERVSHVIYGLDADLIMLGISSIKPVKLLRENMLNRHCKEKFILYHITGVKEGILNEFISLVEPEYSGSINKYFFLRDYIYLLYFVGNDFLPNLKDFEIYKNGIDYTMTIYSELYNKYKGKFWIVDKKFSLNNDFLYEFLKELKDVLQLDNGGSYEEEKKCSTINESEKICCSYLKSSLWNLKYYYIGCPSFSWYYMYHYSPSFDEILSFLKSDNEISSRFNKDNAVSPLTQLLCILPKESKTLVNKDMWWVFDKYPQFYPDPDDIEIDMNGKKFEWQAIVKLPFLSCEFINIVENS